MQCRIRSRRDRHEPNVAVVGLALFAACAMASGSTSPETREPHASLSKYFSIDANDLRALDRGRIIARVEMADERDVLIVGAVRFGPRAPTWWPASVMSTPTGKTRCSWRRAASRDAVPRGFRLADPRAGRGAIARGLPARRVRFQAWRARYERFRDDVDWASPGARSGRGRDARSPRASGAQLSRSGDAGLDELRDHPEPVNRGAEFLTIVGRLPYLQASAPGILVGSRAYLLASEARRTISCMVEGRPRAEADRHLTHVRDLHDKAGDQTKS